MPPPPADYVTKTKARSISPEKPGLGASSSDKKGEGRMIDATFGEDEDDEIQITGSSPSKKRQKLDSECNFSPRLMSSTGSRGNVDRAVRAQYDCKSTDIAHQVRSSRTGRPRTRES